MVARHKDIPCGMRFSHLVVQELAPSKGDWRTRFVCLCDCGNKIITRSDRLKAGRVTSCGCAQREGARRRFTKHGFSKQRSSTYRSWQNMNDRCNNPNATEFRYYGARGITVCERWRSFEFFLADMGERPMGRTLDRKDNNGNYEPGNCRWATAIQQGRNTSRLRLVTIEGITRCLSEWAEISGLPWTTIRTRVDHNVEGKAIIAAPWCLQKAEK